jgi:splicing factor 3B subunit 2
LKQLINRPDVVEAHDVTASDPLFLVYLKSYRNSVPVPRHWCAKRKYLQGKRGIEKPPFQLPEFIAETGIAKIRDTVIEQETIKKSKQKARDKLQPKMGKLDIDYQVLHDAFFKYQTKPRMTIHGKSLTRITDNINDWHLVQAICTMREKSSRYFKPFSCIILLNH